MARKARIAALAASFTLTLCADAWSADIAQPLPARKPTLIRNAYVMTMDPALGDVPAGDVLVGDGRIMAVGKNLQAPPNADIVDGSHAVVMPGLVETHWHMWNTLVRGMEGDRTGHGYFDVVHKKAGPQFTPDDEYLGVMISGAEAINSGTTFVHDWSHNLRSSDHARAGLKALKDLGIRGRFSYGYFTTIEPDKVSNLDDIAAVKQRWNEFSPEGLLDLGMAVRGPLPGVPKEVVDQEFGAAQKLGLPITVHVNQIARNKDMVQKLCDAKLLRKEVLLIHAMLLSDAEYDCIVGSGAAVSLSPVSEMRVGYGFPRTNELLKRRIPVGLSVDTASITGNGSMFDVMRATQNAASGLLQDEFALPARRLLELATIGGAKAIGMDDRIGSLTPGKRADLILVDLRGYHMMPLTDVANLLVQSTQPADVKLVMVDGRMLKSNGEVGGVNRQALAEAAARRNEEIMRQEMADRVQKKQP
ncbi:Cytosine/adenosine deaminase [Noviherbaspirillum humi]|uniref:Cytosine/adenosine deaminase n=1 Tax=Noviherbaspirillum humi TaxID=1688639 RepID=A0A239IAN2_9BURK|nr:amidohydrolase family protein [Noviherbaspirillum humi]SNS89434.1 Cytosine/adenosine deaminase [Noviherbaspirillum humi]